MFVPSGTSVPRTGPAWGLLVATWLSATGNGVVAVAIPWLVLSRTGSATLAGLVGAAAAATLVFSALFGGALVDRWGRLRSSVGADVLSALAVAAVPLAQAWFGLPIAVLVGLVAIGAVFDGPGMAARESLRPAMAHRAGWSLSTINARGEAVDGTAQLAGPAVAGVLITATDPVTALWAAAAMLVAAALVGGVSMRWAWTPQRDPSGLREDYRASVVAGLRLVWRDPALRSAGLLGTIVVMVIVPLDGVVLPALLQRTGTAGGLGAVLGGFAVGGIVGALGYGLLADRIARRTVLVAGLGGTALALAGFALQPGLGWLIGLAVLTGLAAGPIGPVVAQTLQERTPEPLRGRVIGTTTSMALAAAPIGLLIAGPLVDFAGLSATFLVIAAGVLFAAAYAARTRGFAPMQPDTGVTAR